MSTTEEGGRQEAEPLPQTIRVTTYFEDGSGKVYDTELEGFEQLAADSLAKEGITPDHPDYEAILRAAKQTGFGVLGQMLPPHLKDVIVQDSSGESRSFGETDRSIQSRMGIPPPHLDNI